MLQSNPAVFNVAGDPRDRGDGFSDASGDSDGDTEEDSDDEYEAEDIPTESDDSDDDDSVATEPPLQVSRYQQAFVNWLNRNFGDPADVAPVDIIGGQNEDLPRFEDLYVPIYLRDGDGTESDPVDLTDDNE